MACTSIAGRKDLGRHNKGERISAEVECKVADRNESDSRRSPAGIRDTVVDATGDDEKYREYEKRYCQPLFPRKSICEEDEADAPSDRADGHCQ